MHYYSRELLIGSWFRKQYQANSQLTEEARFYSDGQFEFVFTTIVNGLIVEQVVEMGDWGLVGNIHFTITKTEKIDDIFYSTDLTDPGNYQAYKVLNLTNQQFSYQHIEDNDCYHLIRIDEQVGHC
jgi:hypothetical protein